MLAIGYNEQKNFPDLKGESTICHICNKEHNIQYGIDTKTGLETDIAFIKCPQTGSSYLIGVRGRDIRSKFKE